MTKDYSDIEQIASTSSMDLSPLDSCVHLPVVLIDIVSEQTVQVNERGKKVKNK